MKRVLLTFAVLLLCLAAATFLVSRQFEQPSWPEKMVAAQAGIVNVSPEDQADANAHAIDRRDHEFTLQVIAGIAGFLGMGFLACGLTLPARLLPAPRTAIPQSHAGHS